MNLEARIKRDSENAARLPEAAKAHLGKGAGFRVSTDMVRGVSRRQLDVARAISASDRALAVIAERPFDAMVEAQVETQNGLIEVLWYANKDIDNNQVITVDGHEVKVLSWTHAGFQMGLTSELNSRHELKRSGLAIRSIAPKARAKFSQVTPSIAGLYDPGGEVRDPVGVRSRGTGLKAVKLDMTPEQVQAFVARMNGVLIVTGAPGTGKTTVTFQRIRFLFDQQEEREDEPGLAAYHPALTRVFLASRNLIEYSRQLLREELRIPEEVVSFVPDFIASYVDTLWQSKGSARPVTRQTTPEMLKGREALVGLCTARELQHVWITLERQARERLRQWRHEDWYQLLRSAGSVTQAQADSLGRAMEAVPGRSTREPIGSPLRMDALWTQARREYTECRDQLKEAARDRFDRAFAAWLFWVFDPLDVLAGYMGANDAAALARIRHGMGARVSPEKVLKEAIADWERRLYRQQDLPWIAWMLRFVLPETAGQDEGFRGVPRAIPQPDHAARRWTHIVIDEAQDLSVPEASLLASFVHPKGSLTASADFRQVVSPVHGMTDGEALKFGLPIWDQSLHVQFPFRTNLRQGREIAQFLSSFYQATFGEFPPFDPGKRREGIKPRVLLGASDSFPLQIKQMVEVLGRSEQVKSVAVLQVNEDVAALDRLRLVLESLGVSVAPEGVLINTERLILTSVERAKGLEFDACIVLGLDDVEKYAENFAKNRAYVALSRPTKRLFMLCQTEPALLQRIQRDLYERRHVDKFENRRG